MMMIDLKEDFIFLLQINAIEIKNF